MGPFRCPVLTLGFAWVLAGASLAVCAGAEPRAGAASSPDTGQPSAAEPSLRTVEGFTWASHPDLLFVPAQELASALELPEPAGGSEDRPSLLEQAARMPDRRLLPDGTLLLPLRTLARLADSEATVTWDGERSQAVVAYGEHLLYVTRGRRTVVEGVTFAAERTRLYVPRAEADRALAASGPVDTPDESPANSAGRGSRSLPDGTALCSVEQLAEAEADVQAYDGGACVAANERELWILRGAKRVAISLEAQRLRAWQGERLVLETRISSGRPGMDTPQGTFTAGPLKSRMVISHKYGDAEMPWSVQVHRNVFIHGFPSVPPRAASHGCIRMPLTGRNPARWFYRWAQVGTPIQIGGKWPPAPAPLPDAR